MAASLPTNPSPFTAIGIDVGGTKIAAGVVTFPEGRVQTRRQIPTRPERGGKAVLEDVAALVRELSQEAPALGFKIDAIGLALCELVNPAGEIVSQNCLAWRSSEVRQATVSPVTIEADVRAAALAEAIFGAGRGQRIFVYVTVGTGVASCLVIEGRPFTGARGATGTMASSPLPNLGQRSGQGAEFTLEQIASGPALVTRFNQLGGDAKSGQEVLLAAMAGHAGAIEVVRSGAEALGAVVGWLVNVLDPESIVLGGGLGLSEGLFRDVLETSIRRHIWSDLHRELPILRAATGVDAGLIGAATAAWKKAGVGF